MRFALIGAAGYVAPKHCQAIKDVGGELVAICDPADSVGMVDQFFPEAEYFREIEVFDRHLDKLRRENRGVDYVSICSPNYLHDAHCKLAMRVGADAICEKPLVIYPHNLDALHRLERETGQRVHPVLQLRFNEDIRRLRADVHDQPGVTLRVDYTTFRGPWYLRSWKGQVEKSGGLLSNIGIHIIDVILFVLGPVVAVERNIPGDRAWTFEVVCQRGRAVVRLSLGRGPNGERSHRRMVVERDGEAEDTLDFSGSSFAGLHTEVYRAVIAGGPLSLRSARPSIELAYSLREGAHADWGLL